MKNTKTSNLTKSKLIFFSVSLTLVLFSLLFVNDLQAKRESYYYVILKTTAGDITLRLYNETPLHRDNFVKLAKNGFYNGVLFHRVIDNFMIQSGDPDSKAKEKGKLYGDGGPGYNIPAEIIPGIYHKKGVLAAAREGDNVNPKRESGGSQFYIVKGKVFDEQALKASEDRINSRNAANKITDIHTIPPKWREIYKTKGGTPHLDTQYTVFGELVQGADVVEKISVTKTDSNDRPLEDIYIISTKVTKSRKLKTEESN
ncbi:MAG: peptidylprolyl isomerase [Bacteroidetes bacterium HGW-Bacteroidetes-5]|jgi:peptidyl-prolyl cis-trans isomerase B (cyclophilin B)|nr:MAG: peptidylprolyl isomerase [Bacteroidetes bacterium HGW-Bacteroidetes-5]